VLSLALRALLVNGRTEMIDYIIADMTIGPAGKLTDDDDGELIYMDHAALAAIGTR